MVVAPESAFLLLPFAFSAMLFALGRHRHLTLPSLLSAPLSFLSLPVGNIPYGITEEMLADLFAEVGPVKTSR